MAVCKARKTDGQACHAKPLTGSGFCFFHDPDLSDARRQAQCRGGRKQTQIHIIPDHTPEFCLNDPTRITQLLDYAANQLVQGLLPPKSAYVLGYLADCALRAHRVSTEAQKIAELKKLIDSEKDISIGSTEYFDLDFDEPSKDGNQRSESAEILNE